MRHSTENLDRIIPAPAMQDAAASPSQDASSSNTAEATGSELPPSGLVSSLKARVSSANAGFPRGLKIRDVADIRLHEIYLT